MMSWRRKGGGKRVTVRCGQGGGGLVSPYSDETEGGEVKPDSLWKKATHWVEVTWLMLNVII